MLRAMARSALIAGAAAAATWLLRTMVQQNVDRRVQAHKRERKHEVSRWEDEGGGVAPGHPAMDPAIAHTRR